MALVIKTKTGRLLAVIKVLLAIAPALLLAACLPWQSSDSSLEDYPVRLARVLDVATPAIEPLPDLPNPSTRQTAMAMQAIQLSIADWWLLQECQLNQLLAERNSSLGRLHAPSVRFVYEVQILREMQACRANTAETQQLLTQLIGQKQNQLRLLWQHLWLTEPGLSNVLSATPDRLAGVSEQEQWLRYLIQLQTVLLEGRLDQLEQKLGPFQQKLQRAQGIRALPALWHRLIQANLKLADANRLMEHSGQIPCVNGTASAQARQAKIFFNQYYLAKVQPELAQTRASMSRIYPLLQQLERQWPADFQFRFKALSDAGSPERLTDQLKIHAQLWQRLFKRCGFSPGS